MKTALLVVDVQTGLCTGEWAAFDIEAVINCINLAIAQARVAGALVVFIQHEEDAGPLQVGSADWQLDVRLQAYAADPRVRKTVANAFHRPDLLALLQSHGVQQVVVCGLQSEFCVDSTVRGALAQGLAVTLLSDAHSTVANGVLSAAQIIAHHNATLPNLGGYGVGVTLARAADSPLFV